MLSRTCGTLCDPERTQQPVVPSIARDLLFLEADKKADSSSLRSVGMTGRYALPRLTRWCSSKLAAAIQNACRWETARRRPLRGTKVRALECVAQLPPLPTVRHPQARTCSARKAASSRRTPRRARPANVQTPVGGHEGRPLKVTRLGHSPRPFALLGLPCYSGSFG